MLRNRIDLPPREQIILKKGGNGDRPKSPGMLGPRGHFEGSRLIEFDVREVIG